MEEGGFFKKIVVIGLGLIGGSICRALKNSEFKGSVFGIDPCIETLEFAFANGIIDEASSEIDERISDSDLIVIATYLNQYENIFSRLKKLNKEFLIVDTGSVKSFDGLQAKGCFNNVRFIGGHPLAGSEHVSVKFSDENLFVGKLFYIIKYEFSEKNQSFQDDLNKVTEFVKLIGAIPYAMTDKEHDEIMAFTSHLPHFMASLQMNLVMAYSDKDLKEHIGRGFIDSTRIASSSPELWTDVFQMNTDNIIKCFEMMEKTIDDFKELLKSKDSIMINTFFENARSNRERMLRDN